MLNKISLSLSLSLYVHIYIMIDFSGRYIFQIPFQRHRFFQETRANFQGVSHFHLGFFMYLNSRSRPCHVHIDSRIDPESTGVICGQWVLGPSEPMFLSK